MRKPALALAILGLVAGIATRTAEAAQSTARERLEGALQVSRELLSKAQPLDQKTFGEMALRPSFEEDQPAVARNQFPRLADAQAYWKSRPWVVASTRQIFGQRALSPVAPAWPRPEDAPALRALLRDNDSAVRSLAIEALSSLHLPEDVGRIDALVNDQAAGAPVLANVFSLNSRGFPVPQTDSELMTAAVWSQRTVGAYAWIAVRLMTGFHLNSNDPIGVTFEEWWKLHNFGKESLWYWEERLRREWRAAATPEQKSGEDRDNYFERVREETTALQARLRQATLSELKAMPADVQAKVFLSSTSSGYETAGATGPVNELFPEGFVLPIGRDRFLELLNERNLWPDVKDVPMVSQTLLSRLARLAPDVLSVQDWPAVRTVLEMRAAENGWMPVFYSRLLSPARPGNLDDPGTREGYLRSALMRAKERYPKGEIAAEMVRSNLDGQWPVLANQFYNQPGNESSDWRVEVLKALGEAPHTKRKLAALVELINDPRNETILTQVNRVMGMDGYRQQAVWSLNAIAGNEYVSFYIYQDLGQPDRSAKALGELRRLANELLAN
jgi:hypothetical protein